MPLLVWNTKLATHHSTIDEQHKGLLEAYNAVHEALRHGQDRADIAAKLEYLRDFTIHHFRMEQSLMERADYPRYTVHLALHTELVAQMEDVIAAFRQGQVAISPTMMGFLEAWLIEHIQDEDVKLAEWLGAQG